MNTEAVRAFVVVAEEGRFQDAALTLGITQQAVSKRIAALESLLGVALFTRGPRRTELTVDGHAFLPHAKSLLQAAERALRSVRPGSRPLRVDVLGARLASADLLREFHEEFPGVGLDVLTLRGLRPALAALQEGSIDAVFGCPPHPDALPAPIRHVRVYDEPLHLLVGPGHPLATSRTVRLPDLRGHRLWVPGIVPGTEWAGFYESLAAAYDLEISAAGPNFGTEHLLDVIAESTTTATFMGARTRIIWPVHYDLRRVTVIDPTPLYPWSFLWRADADHPRLAELRAHLTAFRTAQTPPAPAWLPPWTAPAPAHPEPTPAARNPG